MHPCLRFPVSLGKGNEGSGNEIGQEVSGGRSELGIGCAREGRYGVYAEKMDLKYWVQETINANRPFPSSLVPLFQSESQCETILTMTLICMKMKLYAELIFI